MRRVRSVLAALVLIWLVIGALAAWQRGYFGASSTSCAQAGTVVGTVVVGPLNYTGMNPKIVCQVPKPSS